MQTEISQHAVIHLRKNKIVLLLLLAVAGCSPKPPVKNFVLPVDFSGVFKVEKDHSQPGNYQADEICDTLTVPANGILLVATDVYESFLPRCGKSISMCTVIKARFADGQEIALFNPLASPADFTPDTQMLLILCKSGKHGDAVWYAVGTHEQLSKFLEQFRSILQEKPLELEHLLESFLPPNTPFL